MTVRMDDAWSAAFDQLRYEPTPKRIRGTLDGAVVVDTTDALLVWEPRRVTPSYAVPEQDIRVPLTAGPAVEESPSPVLHPGIAFAVHTTDGEPVTLTGSNGSTAEGFRLRGDGVDGYVELDAPGLTWQEEAETVLGHPRDPFHRVDVRQGDRHVRISLDGQVLADSVRPMLVFETHLPTRYYLPREDLQVELTPSPIASYCPYKGEASYFFVDIDGGGRRDDLLWSYESPLPDAAQLTGLVGFLNEVVEIEVDDAPLVRSGSVVEQAIVEEMTANRPTSAS